MKISWERLEHEWRKQLLAYAYGNILEVGVESGDNFKYYPPGVQVTATDMSKRMIEKAKEEANKQGVKAEFIVSHFEDLKLAPQSFDTIISTFSLSAYENPAAVLRQYNSWCKAEGLVLLLEYGLSNLSLVSWLQKKWNPHHYKRTGLHIDRDMLALISNSKFNVKKLEMKFAGIVYLMWATMHPYGFNSN